MTKYVIYQNDKRVVQELIYRTDKFTLDATDLSNGFVTTSQDIGDISLVSVVSPNYQPLRNKAFEEDPNFKVVNNDIIFNDVDLVGGLPPENTVIYITYPVETIEDILKENPEIKISTNYDSVTELFKFAVWLHENGQIIAPTSANFSFIQDGTELFNSNGLTPDANGIVYGSEAGVTLSDSSIYLSKISIVTPDKTYTQSIGFETSSSSEIASIDQKIDILTADVATVDSTVNIIDTNVVTINGKVDSITVSLDQIETNVNTINSNVYDIQNTVNAIDPKIDSLVVSAGVADTKLDAIIVDIANIDINSGESKVLSERILKNQLANEYITPQGVITWEDDLGAVFETFDTQVGQLYDTSKAIVVKIRRS